MKSIHLIVTGSFEDLTEANTMIVEFLQKKNVQFSEVTDETGLANNASHSREYLAPNTEIQDSTWDKFSGELAKLGIEVRTNIKRKYIQGNE